MSATASQDDKPDKAKGKATLALPLFLVAALWRCFFSRCVLETLPDFHRL